ncbi:MAG: aconitase X swivel domain-containing protein, partial [Candidatus Bathyarchaeia archaeon]
MSKGGSKVTPSVELKGRLLTGQAAKGMALVTSEPISFFGGLDPRSGRVIERGHAAEGQRVTRKVLVFPQGKGSTVGAYVIYAMAKYNTAPAAIVNRETEVIIASGCALADITLVDKLDKDPISVIRTG